MALFQCGGGSHICEQVALKKRASHHPLPFLLTIQNMFFLQPKYPRIIRRRKLSLRIFVSLLLFQMSTYIVPVDMEVFDLRTRTHSLILAALFAGLTALGGLLRIPFPPVPFTLQVLIVLLSGLLLGSRIGMASQGVYIFLGLAGLPIFAGGGGITYIFSPTFGYVLSYPFAAWTAGRLSRGGNISFLKLVVAALTGLCVIYSVGVTGLFVNLNYIAEKNVTFIQVLRIGLIPFLIPDLLKAGGAAFFASKIPLFRTKTGR